MYDDLKQELEFQNSLEGDLNIKDGYDCPKCKNRGYITQIKDDRYLVDVPCECKKIRITIQRLKNCGIDYDTLVKYSIQNYKTTEQWQENLKNKIKEYLVDDKPNWLVLSGKTGAGKTHLCIATFKYFINNKQKSGQYISWNAFAPKMIALSKSTYTDNQEMFERTMEEMSNTDVLYIDDLFKLTTNKYGNDESLAILYRIINNRYLNKNKITIISTEMFENELKDLDEAVWGRIHERTNGGNYWLTIANELNRNYRIRGNTNE